MIDPRIVFTGICSMLLLIIPGFIVVKFKLVPVRFAKELTKIVLYVAQPCMIVSAFFQAFNAEILNSMFKMLLLSLMVYIVTYLIVFKMFKKTAPRKSSVLRYMMIFSNVGFMGFPMLKAILGDRGDLAVLYGAVMTIWFNAFTWTLGIKFFSPEGGKGHIKELFLNPGVIGVAIGILVFFTSGNRYMPSFAQSSIKILGDTVTPLAMFIIGMRLSEVNFRHFIKDKKMLFAHAMRLLVLPFLIFILLRLIGMTGYIEQNSLVIVVIFILFAMPTATNTVMMAELYDGDSAYASGAVTVSTLLSLFTIPVISLLLLL